MAEAADLGHLIHLGRLLLEAADQQHLPVQVKEGVAILERILLFALGRGALLNLHDGS